MNKKEEYTDHGLTQMDTDIILTKEKSSSLPDGWECKKLEDILTLEYGKPLEKDKRNVNGKYPVYGANGVKAKSDYYYYDKPSIIVGRKGSAGEVNLTDGKFWPLDVTYFIKFDEKENDLFFLYHLLLNLQLQKFAKGVKPGLNRNDVYSISVPLPPLPEQKRIVAILDKAFAAIDKAKANAEKNLANAKELFESYLNGIFSNPGEDWEEKRLGDVCDFTQGIQRDVKLQSENKSKNQVRFLRIVDYTQGNEPPRYIDFPGDKYILNPDDVALVRYGASTGFVCRGLEGALANNLFRVIPKSFEKLTNDFLFIYLQSSVFRNVIMAAMNGAAMPAISFRLIAKICLPLPPIEKQKTIVHQIDFLRVESQKLCNVYQNKIDDLDELKNSILKKAFEGEL